MKKITIVIQVGEQKVESQVEAKETEVKTQLNRLFRKLKKQLQ
jgi:hypothetical protein